MAEDTFRLTLLGVDKASNPLKRIADQMKPLVNAARGVKQESEEGASAHVRFTQAMRGHFAGLAGHFRSAGDALGSLRGSMASFLPMVGAIGAGGSLIGLFTLTKSVAEATLASSALQQQVGITGKELGMFTLAGRMTGVQTDNLAQALTKMQKVMAEAAVGKKEDLAALFKHLNIPLRDSKGAVIGVADALPKLMDAFEATTDQGLRARMASALFEEEGLKLIPMLIQGSKALKQYADIAAKLNYAAPESEKEALKDFERGWIELEMAAGAFKKEVGSRLAPVLKGVLKIATDWVLAIRSDVATLAVDRVKNLAEAFQKLDVAKVVADMRRWGTTISNILRPLGGMYTVIGAITLALGSPLLLAISSVIAIVGALGKVLIGLGALAWANPILASIAAIGLAGYLMYQNWETVKEKFAALWQWFKDSMAWTVDAIKSTELFQEAARELTQAWTAVGDFFKRLWDRIVGYFDAAWQRLRPIVETIMDAARALGLIGGQQLPAPAPGTAQTPGPLPFTPVPVPPMTPLLPGPRRGPRGLYSPSSAVAPAPTGQVNVTVSLENAPPGTRVGTQTTGPAIGRVQTNVGQANPAGIGAY